MSNAPIVDNSLKNDVFFQCLIPGNFQLMNFTATSAQSTAFATGTSVVCLQATEDCYVSFGSNPTAVAATVTSSIIRAGHVRYFGVTAGEKLAVIKKTSDGELDILQGAG